MDIWIDAWKTLNFKMKETLNKITHDIILLNKIY